MTKSNVRRQNEVIIVIPDEDYSPELLRVLQEGGTDQITVDQARSFRTPFGNFMLIASLSTDRVNGSTYDLRRYVAALMTRGGYEISSDSVLAPGKLKRFSV